MSQATSRFAREQAAFVALQRYDSLMADASRYPIPAGRHRAEQSIDRSRFVCTVQRAAAPADAQAFIKEMNSEFADATHNCWAYVAGPPGDTGRIGMSDAGEPHGTAGRPMLTVLLHSGIGEIAAVVTRYYGGIQLGMGGLVKAYGGTVQLALASMATSERVDYVDVTLEIGYANIAIIQQLLPTLDIEMVAEAYDAGVKYDLRVPRPNLAAFRAAVADATRGSATVEARD
jgi:uncharacterized YigZ family protein